MYSYKSLLKFLCFFAFSVLMTVDAKAQAPRDNDTSYYEYFPGSITSRFYFSQKYTAFTLRNKAAADLRYLPNTTLNMGVGATYHNFSLNLAYGFPFLNTDDNKGDTKYLDLQGHFYKPKLVVDFYGQLYKGYHLANGLAANQGDDFYYRHDAKANVFGLSLYRILNDKRFSYRAALIQNEWQKKSAGTLLLGAEIYYAIMNADSSWVPQSLAGQYNQYQSDKIKNFSIGPGAGYAYTLVFFQHLYLTGSATANLHLNVTTEHVALGQNNHFGINPLFRFRAAAGYNGKLWNISANWVWDEHPFRGVNTESKYLLQTGNYRFIVARRFGPGPKLKKNLRLADQIFKE